MVTVTRARRRLILLTVTVLLAVGGVGSVSWALAHQRHAPQPAPTNAGSIARPPAPAAASATARSAGAKPPRTPTNPMHLPASRPTALDIASLDIHSVVNAVGLNANGTLQVPAQGPHYDEAAWYDGSPTPGELGPSVVEGHVDSAANGPSVFFELGAVKLGAHVDVARADGTVAVFAVHGVRRYSKGDFPTRVVYGDPGRVADLRLITCGGSFDRSTGHYTDNVVVFASLVDVRHS